jgi:excinuclease ABC subunit A
LQVRGARHNNLQNLDVEIPLGVLVCVTGASGSGKSSLVHEIIFKKLASLRYDSRILAGAHDAFEGHEAIDDVIDIDQSPIGRSPRSNPATYVGIYDSIRQLFAETDEAKARGFGPATFSFNVKGGRCEECAGDGAIVTQLSFMPDVEVMCPACKGRRYREETLEVTWRGRNIAEVLKLSIEESVAFFADQRAILRKLEVLHELGLGYLELGHAATILSGGEAQRVKLASELGKMRRGRHNLYILDEPTTGLHLADIQRLLDCLQRLVQAGHSVLVIEHHLDVVKCADWILDLGPEGGHQGGQLIVVGTPETVAACESSHTGRALRAHLKPAKRLIVALTISTLEHFIALIATPSRSICFAFRIANITMQISVQSSSQSGYPVIPALAEMFRFLVYSPGRGSCDSCRSKWRCSAGQPGEGCTASPPRFSPSSIESAR